MLFVVLVAVMGLVAAGCATPTADASSGPQERAVEENGEPNRAALGIRAPKHLKVSLITARQMLAGKGGYEAERIAIVVCGNAVEGLVEGSKLEDELEEIQEKPVTIVACGLTVERKGIDEADLIDGVEVVPNGIVELARLQEQGYESIEL